MASEKDTCNPRPGLPFVPKEWPPYEKFAEAFKRAEALRAKRYYEGGEDDDS